MSARGLFGGAAALACLALVGCEAVLGLGDPILVDDAGVAADALIDQAPGDGSSADDGTSDAPAADSTLDSQSDAGPGDATADSPLPDSSTDASVGPVLLVPQGATLVVVGGGALYYALASGGVHGCSAPGCTMNIAVAGGATALSLATDGTNVYVGSAGELQGLHCTLGAGCQPLPGPVPEAGTPLGMCVQSSALYWVTDGGVDSVGLPLDGGAPTSLTAKYGPFGGAAISVTNGGALAWINSDSYYYLGGGSLYSWGTTAAAPDAAPPILADVASDGVTVFAIDDEGQLYTGAADSNQRLAPLPVAGGPDGGTAIAVDDASVYVASSTSVSYVASTGGQMTTLADAGAVDIAVDDKYVYFVNAQGLWRVAKP